jgi:7-cyano-7-deazaguanine reductase
MTDSPLGKTTTYPEQYSPELLCSIPRADNRALLGLGEELPFDGVDIWNAWELTWLGPGGQPRVGTAEIRIPADSPNITESKSVKLYLGSFAMSEYESTVELRNTMAGDIGGCAGSPVDVDVTALAVTAGRKSRKLPGKRLDRQQVDCDSWEVDPTLLLTEPESYVSETLYTDLLRSLCPVTGQPDTGSVMVRYEGPRIDRAGLLRYIVSFRRHQEFHENCVERMFTDILAQCRPAGLTVYARYQRRGGIDINPFRSNFESKPPNLRLWRQ